MKSLALRVTLTACAIVASCVTCFGRATGQAAASPERAVRSCFLRSGQLVADLDPAALPDVSTLAFTVEDQNQRRLFAELIPIVGKAIFRVDVQPIDIDKSIHSAKSVECRVVHILGTNESTSNPACRAPVPVDMGIEPTVDAVEITSNRVVARVTANVVALGALLIKTFRSERLYLRDPGNGRHSSVSLSGPAPKTVFITMSALGRPDSVLEVGVDTNTPLVTFCLST